MVRFSYKWTSWYGIRHNISGAYWDIRNGVRNLIRYAPIIWFDRDWDDHYLLEILQFKFKNMAKAIGDNGHLVGREEYGRQLRVCSELCRRINEDEYLERSFGPFEHFGEFVPAEYGTYRYESQTLKGGREVGDREMRSYYKAADQLKKHDLWLLTTMIRKHLLKWWD